MKKKILHIIRSLNSGGCENFLLGLLPLEKNHHHQVLTLSNKGSLTRQFEQKGVRVDCLRDNWLSLIKYVKKLDPDIVFTYLFHADLLGRIYLGIFSRYTPIPFLRTTYNSPRYRLVRLFEKYTSFLVPKYLANSQSVKDFYIKELKVKPKKIIVIPNGIDLNRFEISKNEVKKFRNIMKVESGDITICCVANLHANKGHKYLIGAFEKLFRKNKNIWLWLVGDGKEKDNLVKTVEKCRSKERIKFLGVRNDVPLILRSSDIFVLPTLFEGMSNAILEAMASGLAIITTNIDENKELIENEVSGLLVSPKNVKGLEKAIDRFIGNKNLRNTMGGAAKLKVKKSYNIVKINDEFEKLITNIIRYESFE